MKVWVPDTLAGYDKLGDHLEEVRQRSEDDYLEMVRQHAKVDLYFLMRFVLSCADIRDPFNGRYLVRHPFIFDFVRDAAKRSHDVIDIAARGHWKSTIKSFAMPIHFIINNPQGAVCIFSVMKRLAVAHLLRIKAELETNPLLRIAFEDVFWWDPAKESVLWSKEAGLACRGYNSRNEFSFEASGLIESIPVGKHYDVLNYDDVVSDDSVASEDMRVKSVERWKSSLNLANRGAQHWYEGTYYNTGDVWSYLQHEIGMETRVKPCVDFDKPAPSNMPELRGDPVFMTPEELSDKLDKMGQRVFGQQMWCDPTSGESYAFPLEYLQYYETEPWREATGKTLYLLCDPANKKGSRHDHTAFVIVGLGSDRKIYLLWAAKWKLDPTERIHQAMKIHREWNAHSGGRLIEVRWEETGLASDTHWLKAEQERQRYRFNVVSVNVGGRMKKTTGPRTGKRTYDALHPAFRGRKILLPRKLMVPRDSPTSEENVDIIRHFVQEEYRKYPHSKEDHILDALALLFHPKAGALVWPFPGRQAMRGLPGQRKEHQPPTPWVV